MRLRRLAGWLMRDPHWFCDRKPCDGCLRLHAQILREPMHSMDEPHRKYPELEIYDGWRE